MSARQGLPAASAGRLCRVWMVSADEAQADVFELIAAAKRGAAVVIARGTTPVAWLVPVTESKTVVRGYGALAHLLPIPDSFFDLLPDDELRLWEGARRRGRMAGSDPPHPRVLVVAWRGPKAERGPAP